MSVERSAVTKLVSKECYTFSDGERIMPTALPPKAELKTTKFQILHPVFLLKSQADAYKKAMWGKRFIKVIKVKIVEL